MNCIVSVAINEKELNGYMEYNIQGKNMNFIQNPKIIKGDTIEIVRIKLHALVDQVCNSYGK